MEITKEEAIKNINLFYSLTDEQKDILLQEFINETRKQVIGTKYEEKYINVTDEQIKERILKELNEINLLLEEQQC